MVWIRINLGAEMSPVPQYIIMKGIRGSVQIGHQRWGERRRLNQDGSEKEEQKGECEGRIEDS